MRPGLLLAPLLMLATGAEAKITCTVTSTNIAFGTWSPSSPAVTGTITVTCTNNAVATVNYTIGLDAGLTGTFAQRLMKSGSVNSIGYNIYTTSARTTIWTNTSPSIVSGSLVTSKTIPVSKTATMYAKMATTPSPKIGSYADTVRITVTY